jgi:hypothetical protein
MNTPILFLDHDGVICIDGNWGDRVINKTKFDTFNDMCVARLNVIIQTYGFDVVVSSDWRIHADIEEMQKLYDDRGLKAKIVGYTEELAPIRFKEGRSSIRQREIKKYVEDNGLTQWFALDDLPFFSIPKNSYRTGLYDGIRQSDMPKIMEQIDRLKIPRV